MTIAEIEELLKDAAKCVVPSAAELANVGRSERIGRLEDYLLDSANYRGRLEEARIYASEAVKELEKGWDQMKGWQVYRDAKNKTEAAVQAAKRECDPDLYEGIKDGKWLVSCLSDQIRRFEQDYEAVSRTYTFATGA